MEIYRKCDKCSATGVYAGMECDHCTGLGYQSFGDTTPPGIDHVQTHEILDATDASEYNALSDNNKDAYKMIISCGLVDLSDNTSARTKLWNMFDAQSTTRANLITLLDE